MAAETKLALDYEAIRRREYELITNLLEVLPRVDNLEESRIGQVRDALFHADHPFLMVFVGPFSSGKSSIINALLGQEELLPVGPVPTTDRIAILRYGDEPQRMHSGGEVDTVFFPSPLLKKVSFVDTPGLQSVMQKHEQATRAFLHRSDVVLLVMLATQAMTASNLEYLQTLKEFGKKVIIVINQVDLLTDEEANTVREYVLEQSKTRLGFKPEIWMISARRGLDARQNGLDAAGWEASGLAQLEQYIDQQLSDVDRLRQKLQTPLQIVQNVHQAALSAVRANQAALDTYRRIGDNVEQQLAACQREQEKTVRETNDSVRSKFSDSAERGTAALREIFSLGKAPGSVGRGVLELIGVAGVLRRMRGKTDIDEVFTRHKVLEPIEELPAAVDKLGPRLEGRDVQDIDALVKYAQKEIEALPDSIRGKVIGQVRAPLQYDRSALQQTRPDLEQIENEAKQLETQKIQSSWRNALMYLGAYELLLVIFGVALFGTWGTLAASPDTPQLPFILLIVLLALGLLGLLIMPLRGRFMATARAARLLHLQTRYIDTLSRAADKQIAYGMQLRRDAVAPLTRLIDSQITLQTEQLNQLQSAEREMVGIESALTTMGKKNILGL
ncbi:MAG: dynamin family protein [Chloroflexi bacterium]|nr:dynamin family protein [Chloroflexota bacterium]